jgi:hypothetical protein
MNTSTAVPNITSLGFDYVEAAKTDVSKTFERFGWKRPDVRRQEAMRLLLNGFNVASMDAGVVAAQAELV